MLDSASICEKWLQVAFSTARMYDLISSDFIQDVLNYHGLKLFKQYQKLINEHNYPDNFM